MSGRVLAQMLVKLLKNGSSIKARLLWSVTNLPPFMRVWAMALYYHYYCTEVTQWAKVFQWMTPKFNGKVIQGMKFCSFKNIQNEALFKGTLKKFMLGHLDSLGSRIWSLSNVFFCKIKGGTGEQICHF